jgi:hypothetical protein
MIGFRTENGSFYLMEDGATSRWKLSEGVNKSTVHEANNCIFAEASARQKYQDLKAQNPNRSFFLMNSANEPADRILKKSDVLTVAVHAGEAAIGFISKGISRESNIGSYPFESVGTSKHYGSKVVKEYYMHEDFVRDAITQSGEKAYQAIDAVQKMTGNLIQHKGLTKDLAIVWQTTADRALEMSMNYINSADHELKTQNVTISDRKGDHSVAVIGEEYLNLLNKASKMYDMLAKNGNQEQKEYAVTMLGCCLEAYSSAEEKFGKRYDKDQSGSYGDAHKGALDAFLKNAPNIAMQYSPVGNEVAGQFNRLSLSNLCGVEISNTIISSGIASKVNSY